MLIPDDKVYGGERSHLDQFWPGRRHEEFAGTLGPISKTLPRFRVRRIDPADANDPWIYAVPAGDQEQEQGCHRHERARRTRHGAGTIIAPPGFPLAGARCMVTTPSDEAL